MKLTSSRFILFIALVIAAMMTVQVLNAQPSRTTLRANIPFGFAAGGQSFGSGDYFVEIDSASSRVLLASADGSEASYFMPHLNDWAKAQDGPAKLVFHKTASGYFLSKVVCAGGTREYQWLPTREQNRAIRMGGVEIAVVPLRSDKVSR